MARTHWQQAQLLLLVMLHRRLLMQRQQQWMQLQLQQLTLASSPGEQLQVHRDDVAPTSALMTRVRLARATVAVLLGDQAGGRAW